MVPRSGSAKRYDRTYFERWYGERGRRVRPPADVERRVRLAVAAAEHVLRRPVRSVLDVGCGEGRWRAVLHRLRPGIRYVGVDPSPYVARRFGRRRGIVTGTFGRLAETGVAGPFDLVVCADVLHYLSADEIRRGLRVLPRLMLGLAYLEAYTAQDEITGDLTGFVRRAAGTYRRLFREAGLVACGLHCYVNAAASWELAALERSS